MNVKVPIVGVNYKDMDIVDLRGPRHPEYNDAADLSKHIRVALSKIPSTEYPADLKKDLCTLPHNLPKQPFYNQLKYLVRDFVSFYFKRKTCSYSIYEERYESIALLADIIPLKYNGKRVLGYNSYARLECLSHVAALSEEIPYAQILEVGCGSGLNMFLLNYMYPHMKIYGFEFTNSRFASALINLSDTEMNGNLFLADVTNIPLHDNPYDVIFSFHVLEQLGQEGAVKALKEMWRLCRRGVVSDEPGVQNASLWETMRLKKLGYCRNLLEVAEELPGCSIKYNGESSCRSWPNTSNILVLKKQSE